MQVGLVLIYLIFFHYAQALLRSINWTRGFVQTGRGLGSGRGYNVASGVLSLVVVFGFSFAGLRDFGQDAVTLVAAVMVIAALYESGLNMRRAGSTIIGAA